MTDTKSPDLEALAVRGIVPKRLYTGRPGATMARGTIYDWEFTDGSVHALYPDEVVSLRARATGAA